MGLVRYVLKSSVLKFKLEGELSSIREKFGIRLDTLQRQGDWSFREKDKLVGKRQPV